MARPPELCGLRIRLCMDVNPPRSAGSISSRRMITCFISNWVQETCLSILSIILTASANLCHCKHCIQLTTATFSYSPTNHTLTQITINMLSVCKLHTTIYVSLHYSSTAAHPSSMADLQHCNSSNMCKPRKM